MHYSQRSVCDILTYINTYMYMNHHGCTSYGEDEGGSLRCLHYIMSITRDLHGCYSPLFEQGQSTREHLPKDFSRFNFSRA